MIAYEIRSLASLPWPRGLGKMTEYPQLERRMKVLMGASYREPDANREGFENDPRYRLIAVEELETADWSADLIEGVDQATSLAQDCVLLGQRLADQEPWLRWANSIGALDLSTRIWLMRPARMAGGGIDHGRHRLTYLRLHKPADYRLLVCINYAR